MWSAAPADLLSEATALVDLQLQGHTSLEPYRARLARSADHVLFVEPFEYLVWTLFDHRPEQRDALLELYRRDPPAALTQLAELHVWPSGRAELLLESRAHFDLNEERVIINLGATSEDEAVTVLVHEFWHALPVIRERESADGSRIRTTGFWSERWSASAKRWLPIEDQRGLIFPPYLLDEAFAYRQEQRATGGEPLTHEAVRRAATFLNAVEALIGAEYLLNLYLSSDDDGFYQAVESHREVLAAYFE